MANRTEELPVALVDNANAETQKVRNTQDKKALPFDSFLFRVSSLLWVDHTLSSTHQFSSASCVSRIGLIILVSSELLLIQLLRF
ncbi:hypothetical protein L6164_034305 [Bauhinia variegata]|uniref:Uncharacterized protein n=1 Tax=Bauhinia variegata TaxID=167791 RepID=A0ACB9KUD7_BAUVA|nr:hypothetical protein L6164_034305 [Bauhinia variegata]